METLLTAAIIMGGLGLLFATVLAVAYTFLKVEVDPRLEAVEDLLPGNNCGACGSPGCGAFAKRLVDGDAVPSECTVGSSESIDAIAGLLGVDAGDQVPDVARLKCAGGLSMVRDLAPYRGISSCRAAAQVDGGGRECVWGCLGLADCEVVCDFDAIHMNIERLPTIDPERCTACGDCVDVCPQDLFELLPLTQRLVIQCNAPLAGVEARSRCVVACDACGRCASDAPGDTIVMDGGLPRIRAEHAGDLGPDPTWRCPTGAIVWLEDGRQFVDVDLDRLDRRAHA